NSAARGDASFFKRMINAPADLAKARAEIKQNRRKKQADDEDFLSMMDEAIKRRKNRDFDQSGGNE
ncbi:MAG: hypothetical protein ACOYI3_01815, partial [Christensenellales bacterium]